MIGAPGEVSIFIKRADERLIVKGDDCKEPIWSGTSTKLFYRCGQEMWAVDVVDDPELAVVNHRLLWSWPFKQEDARMKANYDYDDLRDRFVMVSEDPIVAATNLTIVLNWHEKLRSLTEGQ